MRRSILRTAVVTLGLTLFTSCSSFTSITHEDDGKYVITGWKSPGRTGFILICEYDPTTKTLTVLEEQ